MANVFISWSGDISHQVAKALHEWLPDVLHTVHPWMSTDIDPGARWNTVLQNKLSASNLGVLCLTRENLTAPWLLFEAGALAKDPEVAKVIPYLFRLKAEDIKNVSPPLYQFQSVGDDETGTLELLKMINRQSDTQLESERLNRVFRKHWPDFNARLINIETRDEKRLGQCKRELLNYPRGSSVEGSFIPDSFVQKLADEFTEINSILNLVSVANALRKSVDQNDERVTLIRKGLLVTNNTAYDAWRSVFHEARLNSPRMLAAILMVLPIDTVPLKEERNLLLNTLETVSSSSSR